MPINVEFSLEDQFYDWYLKNLFVRPYKFYLQFLINNNELDRNNIFSNINIDSTN